MINRFDGADGYEPMFRLLQAADGLFYGTTPQGGLLDFRGGDIFRVSASGTLAVLHSFTTTTAGFTTTTAGGFSPNTQVLQGIDGTLYGTNGGGGTGNRGTIFRIDQRVPGPVAFITVSPKLIHSGRFSITGDSTAARCGSYSDFWGSGNLRVAFWRRRFTELRNASVRSKRTRRRDCRGCHLEGQCPCARQVTLNPQRDSGTFQCMPHVADSSHPAATVLCRRMP